MIVMIVEKVSIPLRGELTRWLLEIKPGVYMGDVNAMVRERLWEKCLRQKGAGSVFQAYMTNNEQGYSMRLEGDNGKVIEDWEGLKLVKEKVDCLSEVQVRRITEER